MHPTQDMIVDIPENRVKFFGTTGKMLLPCPQTIASLLKQIPRRRVITTALLREKLTEQFNVEGTCPETTKKALAALANDPTTIVSYWRVVNQNGGLIGDFPGGAAEQAERLSEEGFRINTSGKAPKLEQFKDNLFYFNYDCAG